MCIQEAEEISCGDTSEESRIVGVEWEYLRRMKRSDGVKRERKRRMDGRRMKRR